MLPETNQVLLSVKPILKTAKETTTLWFIPRSWDDLQLVPQVTHDPIFLEVLRSHGMGNIQSPVPLVQRYSKGRRWTHEEFEACYSAWRSGISLTHIAAALNRNPQDIIYKLIARCKVDGIKFSQSGCSEGSRRWTESVAVCAADLFEKGLTAWRIAVLFRVDFEHVEKALFAKRADYGHKKKNPFAICTDHKRIVNAKILRNSDIHINHALDAFAGEGHLTAQIGEIYPKCEVIAVESDATTFERSQQRSWQSNVTWINQDNIEVLKSLVRNGRAFDLIDLDPFVTCYQQLELIWPILNSDALLFITFGGEYRRSFITSNRKAIAKRYGFLGTGLNNKDYLEIIPKFFIGWVSNQAAKRGFVFEVLRAVRYPNTCRFWLRAHKDRQSAASKWLDSVVSIEDGGYLWRNIDIPRFRTVRNELYQEPQGSLFP